MPTNNNPLASNPLRTRADLQEALKSLLEPLAAFTSPRGAQIRLGETATHYDQQAADLEGYARPLWGLAALLAGGGGGGEFAGAAAERWVEGLKAGTDPSCEEYWGEVRDCDQRMVEMCPMGFWMALAGPGESGFWKTFTEEEKNRTVAWFNGVNTREMPNTNWLWFRVFANLALKKLGAPHGAERTRADLDHLETFYDADGWSNDGPPDTLQMDYYSGPFAIQTAQLIYSKLAAEDDPERCELYRERARQYLFSYAHYFDPEGRAIPFGRSTTYRFAMAAFWSALVFAFDDPAAFPAPFSWGVIKGFLLRNLRWWGQQLAIFTSAGTLTIGYAYPNMYFTENYNSPGSPYWCMKAFFPLAVAETHPFWAEEERAYPASMLNTVASLAAPRHIVSHMGGHTFLLSSGQACHYALKAAQAKYGKFAYSSAFGFSVPTGSYGLAQHAIDSMVGLSADGGETWKTRRLAPNARIETHDSACALISEWYPWPDVEIENILIPPSETHPNWHLRAHRIKTGRTLQTAEGAFALYGQASGDGRHLPEYNGHEGYEEGASFAVAASRAGAVGIAELSGGYATRTGGVLRVDPNSNLVESRTVLPTLYADLETGDDVWFVTAVFALPADAAGAWREAWRHAWDTKPVVPDWLRRRIANK
ncbi:hypothetical protein FN846DRAFT_172054 [Sphaerosporella brunnea]|uniref:DUF2264 domain-containing protein n=1 Tax=Sphaerosporella brunnea TaxID=1250544 RepID=A0A5J5EP84_9PEZI|nr:hypothetical protein FN846DRAFT_172054 [Sphaerosporella brunnea]